MINLTVEVKGIREMQRLGDLCDKVKRYFHRPPLKPNQVRELSVMLTKISLSSGSLAYALGKVADIMLDADGRLMEKEDAEIEGILNGIGREIADTGRR